MRQAHGRHGRGRRRPLTSALSRTGRALYSSPASPYESDTTRRETPPTSPCLGRRDPRGPLPSLDDGVPRCPRWLDPSFFGGGGEVGKSEKTSGVASAIAPGRDCCLVRSPEQTSGTSALENGAVTIVRGEGARSSVSVTTVADPRRSDPTRLPWRVSQPPLGLRGITRWAGTPHPSSPTD